ncbi:helix-turn-helix transcriptional regulator [Cohnella algarum]|nr:AraC family transcriptional regulator [Cohnella algarum]MBN2983113.1 helix-turn-helix transcriptional regulator [Cohnella algarum]
MDCLKLTIPPLPQLLTVGHGVWQPGQVHFRRTFNACDMLLVVRGTLFMTEEDAAYEIGPGHWLALEPGKPHWGHKSCEEETELYWIHFVFPNAPERVSASHISWTALLEQGTDRDESPREQPLVIPKWARLDPRPLLPVLDEMVAIQRDLRTGNAVQLQALSMRLLVLLQHAVSGSVKASKSRRVCDEAAAILEADPHAPFRAKTLEDRMHFAYDYIARCMKRHIGLTPHQYALRLKLEEARRRLVLTDLPGERIAEEVGFPDYNYFIRVFRKQTGMTPGGYRRWKQGTT